WESSPGEQHRALMGEIAPFLRGWLIDHIINEDLLMKPFIRH
ncbi:MAG TPA: hemerythrin, partial [Rhodospirillaceae bacterium]|nr:hemerythrin [Rhodospirillaceae bacterium]